MMVTCIVTPNPLSEHSRFPSGGHLYEERHYEAIYGTPKVMLEVWVSTRGGSRMQEGRACGLLLYIELILHSGWVPDVHLMS